GRSGRGRRQGAGHRAGTELDGWLPAVPVIVVARFAVKVVLIVAPAEVPVITPARVPTISGAPVVVREGRKGCGLGVGDGGRP
ncbi:MAG: hypothetical protein WB989_23290, partial [Mycobacterium sp.]